MNDYMVTSLLFHKGKRTLYPLEINGEIKKNKSLTSGEIKSCTLNFFENDKDPIYRLDALNYLKSNNINPITISIDYRLLKDREILNILREKQIRIIRIIGDKYKLTTEDYNNLNFFKIIAVDDCEEELKYTSVGPLVLLQNNKFKVTYDNELINDKIDFVKNYFITDEKLTDNDINDLVYELNDSYNNYKTNLNIRFYNPEKYMHFLTKLKIRGLNPNIKITLLGYPLQDNTINFDVLKHIINNKIEIIYDTCKDMINYYMNEPFHGNSLYQSELEGGGKCSLDEYVGILKVLSHVEKHVKFKNYSPLEAAIYCQKYMNENYTNDPNIEETDKEDYDPNRKLNNVVSRDTIVSVGYSTLYSAMLRKIGIPVFKYSCDRHSQNIMRIKDEKYGIDKIATCDITNDTHKDFLLETYIYFMLSPKELIKSKNPSFITIPLSLIMKDEDYYKYYFESYSPYEKEFNITYHPIGYTIRMLELMGFDFENNYENVHNKFNELNELGYFDKVDPEIIKKAFINVSLSEKPEFGIIKDQLNDYFDNCIKIRNDIFSNEDEILINKPLNGDPYTVKIDLIGKNKKI